MLLVCSLSVLFMPYIKFYTFKSGSENKGGQEAARSLSILGV